MNPFEVKVFMMENGLSQSSIAEDLADEHRKKSSLTVMIHDLIHGRRFYPGLAQELQKKYGIKIDRPKQFESAREIVKHAA